MTSKERVLAALHFEPSDRIPWGDNAVDGHLADKILGKTSLFDKGWDELGAIWSNRRDVVVKDYCDVLESLPRALGWDYVRIPAVPAKKEYRAPERTGPNTWIGEDGFEVQFQPDAGNIITKKQYPDMSLDDLPDPGEPYVIDDSRLEAVRHVVNKHGSTHFVIARTPFDGTFPWEETVGMEAFLTKMITDEEFVFRAIEVWVNRCISYIDAVLDAGVDAIMTTDDYCDNRGPIMGPDLFRKFIVPGIRRQCEAIHARGAYFIKHTDGNLWEVLDDLVDAGIDGWHGIQRNIGMDIQELSKRYRKKLCLFGGVNAETLISGSVDEVDDEVRTAIEATGHDGGLVLTCSNVVAPGVTIENYLQMKESVAIHGKRV